MTSLRKKLFDLRKCQWALVLAIMAGVSLQYDINAQSDDILDRFTLTELNGIVQLDWTISKGSTCNGIGITRSVDSINFEPIGKINGVCGSLTEAVSYSFTDPDPIQNRVNYYQLQLGDIGYSPIISREIIDYKDRNYQVRPNPMSGQGQLLFENDKREQFTLSIYQANGSLIAQQTTRSESFDIDLRSYSSGTFYFDLRDASDRSVASGSILNSK